MRLETFVLRYKEMIGEFYDRWWESFLEEGSSYPLEMSEADWVKQFDVYMKFNND